MSEHSYDPVRMVAEKVNLKLWETNFHLDVWLRRCSIVNMNIDAVMLVSVTQFCSGPYLLQLTQGSKPGAAYLWCEHEWGPGGTPRAIRRAASHVVIRQGSTKSLTSCSPSIWHCLSGRATCLHSVSRAGSIPHNFRYSERRECLIRLTHALKTAEFYARLRSFTHVSSRVNVIDPSLLTTG